VSFLFLGVLDRMPTREFALGAAVNDDIVQDSEGDFIEV
jgi:hypothetical protein